MRRDRYLRRQEAIMEIDDLIVRVGCIIGAGILESVLPVGGLTEATARVLLCSPKVPEKPPKVIEWIR